MRVLVSSWEMFTALTSETASSVRCVKHAVTSAHISAVGLATLPLVLGSSHPSECRIVEGDVAGDWTSALDQFPGIAGFLSFGRIAVFRKSGEALPLIARSIVRNDGCVAWPSATAIRLVAGDAHGLEEMALGAVQVGEVVQITFDLYLAADQRCCGTRSAWVLTEERGEPFGPMFVLEVFWF